MFKSILRKIFKAIVLVVSKTGTGKYLGKISFIKKIEKGISRKMTPEFVTIGKHKIYLDKEDSLRLSTFGELYCNSIEYEIYNKYIKKGDVVIDVGAFIGDDTLEFARLVGKNGKVYAFEITKSDFKLLKKNIKVNNYKNVVLFNKAVSNKDGITKMYINPFKTTGNRIYGKDSSNKEIDWNTANIDSVKLDSVINEKVNFIKIDTEGAEPLIIAGAERILKENKNLKIFLEISVSTIKNFGISAEKYLKKFINLGFRIYKANMESDFEKNKKEIRTDEEINDFIREYDEKISNLFLIKEAKNVEFH